MYANGTDRRGSESSIAGEWLKDKREVMFVFGTGVDETLTLVIEPHEQPYRSA